MDGEQFASTSNTVVLAVPVYDGDISTLSLGVDEGFDPVPEAEREVEINPQDVAQAENVIDDDTQDAVQAEPVNAEPVNHPCRRYECDTCGFMSKYKSSLVRHMNVHRAKPTGKHFQCSDCDKSFRLKDGLVDHEKAAHGDVGFRCHQCGKKFQSRGSLFEHEEIHTIGKKFLCTETGCSAAFTRKSHLEGHVNHEHRQYQPFECTNRACKRKFAYKQSLQAHSRECTGMAPIECGRNGCTQTFSTLSARKEHRAAKHGPGQKCSCGKTYQWRPSLARHQKMTGHDKQ